MNQIPPSSILVIYCNPADSSRLRLDREHRILDQVLSNYGIDKNVILRIHATTIEDLISSLQLPDIQIIHFSGHGSAEGIYLEKDVQSNNGILLPAKKLADLIRTNCKNVHALVLASCYSSSSISELKRAAPYVITVQGPADDESAISFSKFFYDCYFRTSSVEAAIDYTLSCLRSLDLDGGMQLVVSRRAEETHVDRTLVRATIGYNTLLLDITDIESQISQLDISSDIFLTLLTTKLRVHGWLILDSKNMDNVILPIGKYLGVFSWKNGMDVITCNRIICLKEGSQDDECSLWMSLSFHYTLLFSERYRSERQTVFPGMRSSIDNAIKNFGNVVNKFFQTDNNITIIKRLLPQQAKLSIPLIVENYEFALSCSQEEDYSKTITHLETTLSLIHGVLDGLMEKLSY